MPLITKEIRMKSDRCSCVVSTIMDKLDEQRRKKNMMYKQLEYVAKGLTLVVPYQKQFRKMYGMSPYQFTWKEETGEY